MEKLNQHKMPRTCERNHEANRKRIGKTADLSAWTGLTGALDRSDRSCLSKGEQTGLTGGTQKTPKTLIQTVNLDQTTTKIDETWGISEPWRVKISTEI